MTATYLEKDLMWVWPTPHSNKPFANKTVLAFENWRKKIIKGKWEINPCYFWSRNIQSQPLNAALMCWLLPRGPCLCQQIWEHETSYDRKRNKGRAQIQVVQLHLSDTTVHCIQVSSSDAAVCTVLYCMPPIGNAENVGRTHRATWLDIN